MEKKLLQERLREMLDGRYDEIKSGRASAIDGESFFEKLRQRKEGPGRGRNLRDSRSKE